MLYNFGKRYQNNLSLPKVVTKSKIKVYGAARCFEQPKNTFEVLKFGCTSNSTTFLSYISGASITHLVERPALDHRVVGSIPA